MGLFNSQGAMRYASRCNSCHREYNSAHYRANKADYRVRTDAWHAERKELLARIVEELGGCATCPEDDASALDFHHLNPSEKDGLISEMIRAGRSTDFLVQEIRKCALLCSNCHRKVHAGKLSLLVQSLPHSASLIRTKSVARVRKVDFRIPPPRRIAPKHGATAYRAGCRCQECRRAHASATCEYRKRHGRKGSPRLAVAQSSQNPGEQPK